MQGEKLIQLLTQAQQMLPQPDPKKLAEIRTGLKPYYQQEKKFSLTNATVNKQVE